MNAEFGNNIALADLADTLKANLSAHTTIVKEHEAAMKADPNATHEHPGKFHRQLFVMGDPTETTGEGKSAKNVMDEGVAAAASAAKVKASIEARNGQGLHVVFSQ